MRTRRATNCAIAPCTGSTGYQSPGRGRKPSALLARGARQVVVSGERSVVEVLEDRILVVDLQHHSAGTTQPRWHDVELGILGALDAEPRPRHPLRTTAPHLLLDAGLAAKVPEVEDRHR